MIERRRNKAAHPLEILASLQAWSSLDYTPFCTRQSTVTEKRLEIIIREKRWEIIAYENHRIYGIIAMSKGILDRSVSQQKMLIIPLNPDIFDENTPKT